MEELRDVSSEQLEHFLDDARDLHGKFGNPGRPTLAKLLEPINGNPNPKRITEIIDLFETMYFVDLDCLLYTSPSPRDGLLSRMPSSA